MAEIDPVILQLRAEVNGYLTTLRSATTKADQMLGTQEKRIRQLEAQFSRSSNQISADLKGLAAAFAGAFTAQEVIGLIDSFTRLQNSLKVAGLEGQNLAAVQERLYQIGARYGVSVNELANIYGRATQAQKDLGASSDQILQITNSTAQALKITGTSTQAAAGAMLGLTQALSSGIVRAEEFNQINEGGLRPLLQVAAASDRWGGSVAKLRSDIADGKVTSQEFFAAILAGSQQLEGQASKATLTLAGAFQALGDQLARHVGEAGAASGATNALAAGIKALADNLDLVLNALAVIAVAFAGRFVAGMVAAAAASRGASTALFALQARMAGAATTAEALAFAGRAAGASLLAAFGGPVGLAITALTLGIGYLATEANSAADATANLKASLDEQSNALGTTEAQVRKANAETGNLTSAQKSALVATANLTGEAHKLADAWARVAAEAKLAAIANAEAALDTARTNRMTAEQAYQRSNSSPTALIMGGGKTPVDNSAFPGASRFSKPGKGAVPSATLGGKPVPLASPQAAQIEQARRNEEAATRNLASIRSRQLSEFRSGGSAATGGSKGSKARKGRSGASGPSAAEVAARFDSEMLRLEQEELRAKADLALTAGDRADLQKDALFAERAARIAAIESDKDFTRKQKDAQIAAINRLYGEPAKVGPNGETVSEGRPGLLAQRINRDAEQEMARLSISQMEAQLATLDAQIELETNITKRNDMERRALALYQKIERARVEEAIAAGQIAESARDELAAQQKLAKQKLDRAQRTPGQVYRDDLREAADNINAAIEDIEVKGLQSLNDGIVEAIMGTKSLGDVFKSVANQIIADLLRIAVQRAVIEPLANALFGGGKPSGGSGSGFLGSAISAIGSIFGRASGGYVAPGQMVRVNEAASPGRVEGFMSRDGGQIIPLGQMNAVQAGGSMAGGVVRIMIEEGPNFLSTIRTEATGVSVEVVKASAPSLIDASARETMARAGRPRM